MLQLAAQAGLQRRDQPVAGGVLVQCQQVARALGTGSRPLRLVAGIQVVAEIDQGRRSVLDYLLSPVRKVVGESGRER